MKATHVCNTMRWAYTAQVRIGDSRIVSFTNRLNKTAKRFTNGLTKTFALLFAEKSKV